MPCACRRLSGATSRAAPRAPTPGWAAAFSPSGLRRVPGLVLPAQVIKFMTKKALPSKQGGALRLQYPIDVAKAGQGAFQATKQRRQSTPMGPSKQDKAALLAAAQKSMTLGGRQAPGRSAPTNAQRAALANQALSGRATGAPSNADKIALLQRAKSKRPASIVLNNDVGADAADDNYVKPPPTPIYEDATHLLEEVEKPSDRMTNLAIFVAPLDPEAFDSLWNHATVPSQLPPHFKGKHMNRYWDILPNPTTRVRLPRLRQPGTTEFSSASGYVNANFIRGYGGEKAKDYIAAQAPLPSTIYNFIRMIWHYKLACIVMTTGLVEGTKRKCERYWPETAKSRPLRFEAPGGPTLYVIHKKTEELPSVRVHHLQISDGKHSHFVRHFWYHAWPDHGVPTNSRGEVFPNDVISLMDVVSSARREMDGGLSPLLVHCSAGVGRTGTFIVIDHVMQAIKHRQEVDICELVSQLREDRMTLVQHTVQYKFAYQACINYAQSCVSETKGADIYALASCHSNTTGNASIKRANTISGKQGQWKSKEVNGAAMYALEGTVKVELTEADKTEKSEGSTETDQSDADADAAAASEDTPLEQQPWYRHAFTRSQVNDMLTDVAVGTFVVRQSSQKGIYVISVLAPSGVVLNVRLMPELVGGQTQYRLGLEGDRTFETIVALVTGYGEHASLVDKADGKKFKLLVDTASTSQAEPQPKEKVYESTVAISETDSKALGSTDDGADGGDSGADSDTIDL